MEHYQEFVEKHKRDAYILERTVIGDHNYEKCKEALRELSESKEELCKNIDRYPLEICFCDLRYVLGSRRDVEVMLFVLEGKIQEYEELF